MLILSGFLLGQGSMFAVQTYLVINQQFEKIAEIGISLAILSLFQWIADGGGVYYLSKIQKTATNNLDIKDFVVARLVFSILFSVLTLPVIYSFDFLSVFSKEVLYFSVIASLIWSFNLTGVADARNSNKLIGPTSGLSWLFASITTLFFLDHKLFSIYLGFSFCLGLFLTLFIQITVLKFKFNKGRFNFNIFLEHFKSIFTYNVAYVAAQSYSRVLLVLVDFFIGSKLAGLYLYAKSFVNFAGQLIVFTRRVEFPKLVKLLNEHRFSIFDVVRAQWFSLFVALFSFMFVLLLSFIFNKVEFLSRYSDTFTVMSFVSAALVFWVVSSSLGQVFVGLNKNDVYAKVVSSSAVISVFVCYVLLVFFSSSLSVIIFSEIAMYVFQFLVYAYMIKVSGVGGAK
jgi:hypothetical protein